MYRIFLYTITFILSPFLANHINLCLEFCIDIVSNIDPVSMIFAISLQQLSCHINKMLRTTMVSVLGVFLGFFFNFAYMSQLLALAIVGLQSWISAESGDEGFYTMFLFTSTSKSNFFFKIPRRIESSDACMKY